MAILSKEEFLNKVNGVLGTRVDDEAIGFLEDMADTYNDLENKAKGDGEDWEAKYRENDKAWQQKYRRRFMSGAGSTYVEDRDEDEEDVITGENITIDDIFKERE